MSHNSPASEEQLPGVFRRLGKTVPPLKSRSYSGNQQDIGLRIARPVYQDQQQQQQHQQQQQQQQQKENTSFYAPQHGFQHPNYPDMVIQSSTPPPMYYRPQMSNETDNTVGFHDSFNNPIMKPNVIKMNNNNNSHNNGISTAYHSPAPPVSSAPPIPQNAFSFIPRDVNPNPNPNPVISFVRNVNPGIVPNYNAPYPYFNGSMNQVSMNNGQQILQHTPPVSTPTSPVVAAPAAPASFSKAPNAASSSNATKPKPKPKAKAKPKKDTLVSSENPGTSNSSARNPELKKTNRQTSIDVKDANDTKPEDTPTNQRDILAKSIKIIASRRVGTDKNGSNANRKHGRPSDSEDNDMDTDSIFNPIINRKVVVATDDTDREKSPIRKRPRRPISPTIPKRKMSLSDGSDADSRSSRGRYAMRSPSLMYDDRHSRSRSRSRSISRSRSSRRRRGRSISRSISRSLSRSISPPPPRRERRRSDSTRRPRNHSPGSSSDEEKAPFLMQQVDRYVPDYVRRPLPPQHRRRSPNLRRMTFSSVSRSPSPPRVKRSATETSASINDRLNQLHNSAKPKNLGSYPPLGSYSLSMIISRAPNSDTSTTITATSSSSKSSTAKNHAPINHKIITKPSPAALKSASTTSNSNSPVTSNNAQSKSIPKASKKAANDVNMVSIKQEVPTESTNNTPEQATKNVVNAPANGTQNATTNNSSTTMTSNNLPSNVTPSMDKPAVTPSKKRAVADEPNVAQTSVETQSEKRRVFHDGPAEGSTAVNAAGSSITNGTLSKPVAANAAQPIKPSTISQEKRAAIKKRAAKEKERLDQERLRQLDIDDRDDIVMDIAYTTQSKSATTITSANTVHYDITTNTIATATEAGIVSQDSAKASSVAADINKNETTVDRNTNSSLPSSENHQQQNGNLAHNILVESNMTSHENVHSGDTATAGTNGAFTYIVSANNVSVPEGDTIESFKSMTSQNSPLLSPPASLQQQEPLTVPVEKPIIISTTTTTAAAAAPVPNVTVQAPVVPPVASAPTQAKRKTRVPKPWKAKMNDSGDIYYTNAVTGEITFTRPE